jgi:outer membrane lipoprotein-sorting protein
MKRVLTMLALALIAASGWTLGALSEPSAEEILKKVDENQAFQSIEYTGRMEITLAGETRVKTMKAWAIGDTKAFIEFTNPEDRGTRMLKLDKNLWMYFPKEQDTVKISGHLLKEGMMGSDVSYEDAMESDALLEKYSASILREEDLDGRPTWVLELRARVPTASYDRRVIWIDKERYVSLRGEMYARSGKLLKESRSLEVRNIGGRWYPVRTEMINRLRRDTRTVFILADLKLDVKLEDSRFSMTELTR